MKFFVAITILAFVGVAFGALTAEQKEKLKQFKKECLDATPGLDPAVIEKAKQGEFSDDAKLGEWFKCFGTKLNFINADGSYNVPVIKEKLAKKVDSDPSAIVDKCTEKDEKDGAKNAVHLAVCLKKNLPPHEGVF